MNSKIALITGITGQDGSYLAEFFYQKGIKYMASKKALLTILKESITL